MTKPELKQFSELEPEDFERHPVWIGCHTADYGEPWYDSTDEETFRPWTGRLPVDSSAGMLLIKASFELHDGSRFTGFVTPSDKSDDLATQQPQLFVGDQRFSFWGGRIGIANSAQQALYAALNKDPQEIFPLRFAGNVGLATGNMTGFVRGFYGGGKEGIGVEVAARQILIPPAGPKLFRMEAHGYQPDPQPHNDLGFKELTFSKMCRRCGIHSVQFAPFRFEKFNRRILSDVWQPQCFFDVFIVASDIGRDIEKAGISGVSMGPILDHASGAEIPDHLQMHIKDSVSCVETSHLPTVTCRPNNEEAIAIRNLRKNRPSPPKVEDPSKPKPDWKVRMEADMQKLRERMAAIPFCGRVKWHPPTDPALVPLSRVDLPDVFNSAEWFGSGALAFRYTIASERFADLVRKHKWRGFKFSELPQDGYSERKKLDY
jgi:hypothetical protein